MSKENFINSDHCHSLNRINTAENYQIMICWNGKYVFGSSLTNENLNWVVVVIKIGYEGPQ